MTARDAWLQERMLGIGGSDAAAAIGLSRFKTACQLYLEKRGELEPENLDDVEYVRFGNLMEEIIAREYARRNEVKVRRRNQIVSHPKHPWMRASVDRLVEGRRVGLECKNVDAMAFRFGEWGEPGTDEVPEEYLLQCQHYMAVLGYPEWHLAACVGGNRLKTYIIPCDAELQEMLIEREHAFWQRVQSGDRPELDYEHRTTLDLLKRIHPGTDGSEVDLSPVEHWHKVRVDAAVKAKEYGDMADKAKAHILEVMGRADKGALPDGTHYQRKLITKKPFTCTPEPYVELRHVKPRKTTKQASTEQDEE